MLQPLEALPGMGGSLRLIKDGRHRAARDLLAGWLPSADDHERALRQRDRQLEGAG